MWILDEGSYQDGKGDNLRAVIPGESSVGIAAHLSKHFQGEMSGETHQSNPEMKYLGGPQQPRGDTPASSGPGEIAIRETRPMYIRRATVQQYNPSCEGWERSDQRRPKE